VLERFLVSWTVTVHGLFPGSSPVPAQHL